MRRYTFVMAREQRVLCRELHRPGSNSPQKCVSISTRPSCRNTSNLSHWLAIQVGFSPSRERCASSHTPKRSTRAAASVHRTAWRVAGVLARSFFSIAWSCAMCSGPTFAVGEALRSTTFRPRRACVEQDASVSAPLGRSAGAAACIRRSHRPARCPRTPRAASRHACRYGCAQTHGPPRRIRSAPRPLVSHHHPREPVFVLLRPESSTRTGVSSTPKLSEVFNSSSRTRRRAVAASRRSQRRPPVSGRDRQIRA